jgi:four helix bundle protein
MDEPSSLKIKTFRDLLAWQRSMELVVAIYRATKSFPKAELFALNAQMQRAAVSIPSNLAEGFGRRSRIEYIRFINIALGSLCELQTQIEIAARLAYLDSVDLDHLESLSRETEYLLSRLRQKLFSTISAKK